MNGSFSNLRAMASNLLAMASRQDGCICAWAEAGGDLEGTAARWTPVGWAGEHLGLRFGVFTNNTPGC